MGNAAASSSTHFTLVASAILEGRVVPFLGAGANLCNREKDAKWTAISPEFPSGAELAQYLANTLAAPSPEYCANCQAPLPVRDLMRVSQNAVTLLDEGRLYEKLHWVFSNERASPTSVHRFLAGLALCAESSHLLIATTNYDNLMEAALKTQGKEYDVVFFDPDGAPTARFCHRGPDGKVRPITEANSDPTPFCEKRPVVLKIHGTVDHLNIRADEGWVITEDHYIDYLADQPLERLLPTELLLRLRANHLLFLGYSLRDWNFRVFLRRLKRKPKERYRSWAVVFDIDEAEREFWAQHGVGLVEMDLKTYIETLDACVAERRHQLTRCAGENS